MLRNKKGKEAETIFNVLIGMQQLPITLATSSFSLDLHCYRTGENVVVRLKMTLTYGAIILNKRKLLHLTAKSVRKHRIRYLFIPNHQLS